MVKHLLCCLCLLVTLTACSRSEPPEETVFDDQLRALDKAREVQGVLEDSAERRRRGLEGQE